MDFQYVKKENENATKTSKLSSKSGINGDKVRIPNNKSNVDGSTTTKERPNMERRKILLILERNKNSWN